MQKGARKVGAPLFITRYWLAVLLQLLVIGAIIAVHSYSLATGRPVLLKTAPVTPGTPCVGSI